MNGQNYGWANALADVLSTAITKNAQDKQYQQGLDYISQQEAQNKALSAAQQDYAKTQDWYAQANKIVNLNKDWANYQAQGLDNNDPQMQKIIADSKAIRQYGQQKGYNLPDQDVPYGNIQGFIDNEGNTRIAKLADLMKKSGYADAGQFVRPSDMGHDVGPTQAPTYNLDTSLQGMGDYIKQLQADNNSPLSFMTGMAKLKISPEVMQKLTPLYNAYMKSNNDQEAIALLGQYQTEPDPVKKAQIIQQYYNLIGKDGLGVLKDLTPQQKAVQWNNGGQQGIDMVTTPSILGTGGAGVTNLQTRDNTLNPGQVLGGQEFIAKMSQDDKHFYATFNLQAQKLQNNMANDAARIQLAQKNSSLSGFGTLLSDLRGRASNALRGAQEVIAAHKNNFEANYNPQNDSEVQRYMQDYQAYSKQADTISNQLGAAMGLNIDGQQQSGKAITVQEKAALNNKYTDDQLRAAGYTW